MTVDGTQIDYGQVLKDMAGEETLRGKLDMKVQVRASGTSVRSLMAKLDGKLRVQSENGYVDTSAFAFLTGPLMMLFEDEDSKTLKCAVVDFDITKGQATSKAIVFETGGLSIVGEGGIDLAEEKLALYFDPRAKSASFTSAAEIGIVVVGTMKEPSVGADMGDASMEAASLAAGISTGGLSTIIGIPVDTAASGIGETDYCGLALAGKSVKPGVSASSSSSSSIDPNVPAEPAAQEGVSDIGGVIEDFFGD